MALFSKGRGRSRGGDNFRAKGGSGTRGQGRGRGRGSNLARGGPRSTFNPTRIEEIAEDDSNEGNTTAEEGLKGDAYSSDNISSDEDNEDIETKVKPYSVLLQSLNASVPRGQPQTKKRKVKRDEDFGDTRLSERSRDEYPQNTMDSEMDLVEEPEEGGNLSMDAVENNDDDNEDISDNDPFAKHISDPDEAKLAQKIQNVKDDKWVRSGSSVILATWKFSLQHPVDASYIPLLGAKVPIDTGNLPLKQKLQVSSMKLLPPFNHLIGNLASCMLSYRDLLLCHGSSTNADSLRKLTSLHALNHIFKTRDKVIKNNGRIARDTEGGSTELRDQGFTRPKVLIILPTRQSCVKYVDTMISLCEPEQEENRKRFQDSYARGDDEFSDDKPEDFRELFNGNDDDMFRLGMKFTRKTVKYFAQFYNSDIIFASPLGLRMAIGTEDAKKQDHDFLSSIEVVIVDQANALLMQNWEHVEYIFEHLNLQPKEAHGCDFSRVRNWYLDGNAKYIRQTILLTNFNFPALNRIFSLYMSNVAGKAKFGVDYDGAMLDLSVELKQTFSRYDYTSRITDPDNRFEYFTAAIVPILAKHSVAAAGGGQGVLIYLPSYADFVRVRNYLATSASTQNISFGSISEYTSVRDVARARSHFYSGRHSVLLYTERAHHFRRYRLRGVKKVVMYGLPENPIFYKEVVGGFLGSSISESKVDPDQASVRSIFSRLDMMKLERIVGSSRYVKMLADGGGDTFDFV